MPAHKKHVPKEILQNLYLEQGLSPRAIGARLGCGETVVRKRLKEYAIPLRSRAQAIRLGRGIDIDPETLVDLYHNQRLTIPRVAAQLGCSEDTIRSRMKEYAIPSRTPSESALLDRGIDLSEDLAREWYEQQQLSTAAIAQRLGCSATTVSRKLAQYGIERRTPWAYNSVDLDEETLRRLYEEEGLTVEAIAEMAGCGSATVSRKMSAFGVEARPPWRVRYPRSDFTGDPLEKAYLIGFRLGDLTVRRAELSIEVIMTTTCQEQVDLMFELFDRYGHVYEHHRPDGRIFLETRLNDSFEFLLPKEDRVPDWVLADEESFFAFLAGYVDADGSIRTVGPRSARLDVQTYDSGILRGIWEGTTAAGIYCASPRVVVQAGWTNNVGIVQRQDKWGIWIHRRKHLHRLLERMLVHLRHAKRRNDALTALRATESRT